MVADTKYEEPYGIGDKYVVRRPWIYIFVLLVFAISPSRNIQCANSEVKRVSVSVPDIKIEKTDRIVEYKVTILYGFVVSVPRIPPGWFLRIDLPLQWKTNVMAGSIIGVADLNGDETGYFNDFLVLEYSGHEGQELNVEAEVTVNAHTGSKKVLRFGMEELRIKRIDHSGRK